MTGRTPKPEFDRAVRGEDIGPDGLVLDLVAGADERAALVARFGLEDCAELRARARLEPLGRRGYFRLSVDFRADVVQSCVVTLDSVPARIEDRFTLVYGPEADFAGAAGLVNVAPEGEDPPEPMTDGAIPVGEAIAEHLALALDPYPRKPGVAWDPAAAGRGGGAGAAEPFAVLRALLKENR